MASETEKDFKLEYLRKLHMLSINTSRITLKSKNTTKISSQNIKTASNMEKRKHATKLGLHPLLIE